MHTESTRRVVWKERVRMGECDARTYEPERRLAVLEQLLSLETVSLKEALERAATFVGEALDAEKVDALLFSPVRHALVAVGVSNTPLGHRERALGLDVLPLDDAGSLGEVYRTKKSVVIGNLAALPGEPPGAVHELGTRSLLAAPLEVSETRRGVLAATSTQVGAFNNDDLDLLEAVAHWVGLMAHRALLLERAMRGVADQAPAGSSSRVVLDMGRRAEEERALADEARAMADIAQLAADEAGRAANERVRAAEEAIIVRDHLLSVVAHDLRTPLTNVLGRVAFIRRRLDVGRKIETDWLRDQIDSLQTSAERLLDMVRELTDASALAQGHALELHLERLDLTALICSLLDEMKPHSDLDVLVEAPATSIDVWADRTRLHRVVQNLLDNALKYSTSGSAVRVRIQTEGDTAVIAVQDEGVGIPPDELDHVFQPYYRASTSAGVQGTGLGLASARAAIEQHGGSIVVKSELGVGTTVTVRLPVAPPGS